MTIQYSHDQVAMYCKVISSARVITTYDLSVLGHFMYSVDVINSNVDLIARFYMDLQWAEVAHELFELFDYYHSVCR